MPWGKFFTSRRDRGALKGNVRVKTHHKLLVQDARDLSALESESVQLVVTSPPYPMIAMWDSVFSAMNPEIKQALSSQDGMAAFEFMHQELDKVWEACARILSPSGFMCINIGDATRTLNGDFRLYPNHARILTRMAQLGFSVLPDILWRKPTNAPNKFMGSGMLPAGAYVTYEHEYILVFRKGGKRVFSAGVERENRLKSAYFWEERNTWFSDVWSGLRGANQKLGKSKERDRSAAYPFELPHRLIQMYSVYGDTILDPFVGTGTTMAAAVTAARSSVGVEIAEGLSPLVEGAIQSAARDSGELASRRLHRHFDFVAQRLAEEKVLKHRNGPHAVSVMTRQETEIELQVANSVERLCDLEFQVTHTPLCLDEGAP